MSGLQLNEPQIPYKEFYGKNVRQMPRLIAEGRVPLSVQGLMRRRLETQYASSSVREAWMDNYFDTGDGIAYNPDGRIKVVLDAQPLRELNTKSKLENGALVLPYEMYENLEGPEFTRTDIKKYVDKELTRNQAKSNPLWQALARDQHLLNEYVDLIFEELKRKVPCYKGMQVEVDEATDYPYMQVWHIAGLDEGSYANGWLGSPKSSGGRLVGVLPAAQGAKSITLEDRIR